MNKDKQTICQEISKELEEYEYPLTITEIVEKTLELVEEYHLKEKCS